MKTQHERDLDMLDEYDFSGKEEVRGKYYQAYRKGHTVRIHQEDGSVVMQHFAPEEDAIVTPPLLTANLSEDSERRLRFMKTRKALEDAISIYDSSTAPSNEDIVKLVKQARKASKS